MLVGYLCGLAIRVDQVLFVLLSPWSVTFWERYWIIPRGCRRGSLDPPGGGSASLGYLFG